MTKAALLGTSALSDAFSVAFMIPNLFRRLFAEGSIAVAFIPAFKSYLLDGDAKKTKEFLHSFWTVLTLVVSIFTAAGIVCSPVIVKVFHIAAYNETVLLTRIMFPFLAFISVAAFFQGILNSAGLFAPSAIGPILLNIVTIICAWTLKDTFGNPARAMAVGIIAGGFLEAAVQFPFVYKRGFTFFWTGIKSSFKNPGTIKVLKLIGPTIIGMAAYQLNDIVSTALASRSGEGVVSGLQYSLRLQELLLGIFAVSIGTVLLPDLAGYAKKHEWDVFTTQLQTACEIIALIMIPISFFFLCEGADIIRFLFLNRSFTERSVALTLSAFRFHIPGLFFIALNRVLSPAFYAQNDSASPTIAGIASFAVNIIAASVLVYFIKIHISDVNKINYSAGALALALSVSSAVNTVLLFLFFKNIKVNALVKNIIRYTIKMLILSLIASLPVFFLRDKIHFIISGVIFAACGALLLLITRDVNITRLINIIKKKPPKAAAY
jgi:putative peptidoglycan lipid II flippase